MVKENTKEDDIDITNWQYFDDFEEYVEEEEDNKPNNNIPQDYMNNSQSRRNEEKLSRKRESRLNFL